MQSVVLGATGIVGDYIAQRSRYQAKNHLFLALQRTSNVKQRWLSLRDWLTRTFGPLEVGVRKSDKGHSQSRLNKAG
jgi:hypothetical protein